MLLEQISSGAFSKGFVGRETVIKQLTGKISSLEGAVVLVGPGGSGKTVTLGQVATAMAKQDYSFILTRGETLPEFVLNKIFQKARKKGIPGVEEVYAGGEAHDLRTKILWLVEHYLQVEKVMLIFQDFDANLNAQGKFKNERTKEFLTYLKESLQDKPSVMFFTSQTRLPGFEFFELPPFSLAGDDFKKFLSRCTALSRMDEKSREKLNFDVGSNPRSLVLLDRLAAHEFSGKKYDWEQLKSRIPGLNERILYKESEEIDITSPLLGKIMTLLDEPAVALLKGVSIYRGPVKKEALTALGLKVPGKVRKSLLDWGLIEWWERDDMFQVHPMTARYMRGQLEESEGVELFTAAARYLESLQSREEERDLEAEVYALDFYLEAGETHNVADLAFKLDQYLAPRGYVQLAFDILEKLENIDVNRDADIYLRQRLGFYHTLFGNFDRVITNYEKLNALFETGDNLQGQAFCLGQIGMAYEQNRKFESALENYEKSRDIYREIEDQSATALTILQMGKLNQQRGKHQESEAQLKEALEIYSSQQDPKGRAECLYNLGRLHEEKGELDRAQELYIQTRELKETLKDTKGVATCLHHEGNLFFLKGDMDSAQDRFNKSLEAWGPDSLERGAGYTHGQLGMILQQKGSEKEALEHYTLSLEIFEKIQDPQGMAAGYHQMGRISQTRGELQEALEYYKKSIEIREKNADMSGMGIGYGQLGMLYFEMEDYEEALKASIKAFLLFSQLKLPQAQLANKNIQRIQGKMPEEKFFAILKEFNIVPGEKKEDTPPEGTSDPQDPSDQK